MKLNWKYQYMLAYYGSLKKRSGNGDQANGGERLSIKFSFQRAFLLEGTQGFLHKYLPPGLK